eukprot:scaffold5443_cov291-Pinguiococcus_pyrenoidosus.AAC.8
MTPCQANGCSAASAPKTHPDRAEKLSLTNTIRLSQRSADKTRRNLCAPSVWRSGRIGTPARAASVAFGNRRQRSFLPAFPAVMGPSGAARLPRGRRHSDAPPCLS